MSKNGYLIYFTLILFFYFGLVFSQARGANEQTDKLVIGSIATVGNTVITDSQVLSKVRSRVGQLFDGATAAEDAKRISELEGVEYSYYNIVVSEDKIRLTFAVVESNLIRSIEFVGNRKYKARSLRKKLGFKTGDYFDAVLAEPGAETLTMFYRKKGYSFAQVKLDKEGLSLGKLVYTVDEGPRVKITAVRFSGNKGIKTRALRKTVKLKKHKFFVFPNYHNEEYVAKDVARLQDIYYKRGYLNSSIKVKRELTEDRSKIRLTFVIDEGAAYTIEKIIVTGVRYFEEGALRADFKSREQQVYNKQRIESDVKRLVKLYRENGFIEVRVKYNFKYVSEDKVNVEIEISEGERFRIGRINITGNEETQDRVIRRVLDEYDFQPGKWYNADIAQGDGRGRGYLEKLIRQTVLTESVTITPSGDEAGKRDAQVSVIEGQTGSVMVGAGVASDSGVIGQLVFDQRNFDISDRPESLGEFITGKAFKGAGQHLRIALQPGTIVSQYSISFTEPYLNDKPVGLDVVGSSYERWQESHDERRMKGYLGFEKREKNRWRKSIGFRVEEVEIEDIDFDAPQEIIDVAGGSLLAGIKVGIGRDLTDDKFIPSTGYNFNVSYEQVAGDYTFGIVSGVHRGYHTLYEDLEERKTILSTKLLGASIVGGDAPPFERFYGGGTGFYGLRGFDYRGVSPRGLQTGVSPAQRIDPIGSDWIFLANVEVVVPLVSDNLGALFFVDSGTIDTGDYRVSAGVGIQILLPQWFGPVPMRFELATPLMKDDSDDVEVFSFSVGRMF
ncbi:MAG: outer membrane protein assembly factor BamA [Planctomycetota bacterium]|jgi:outer membrane protein assembly complex protein YaeT